VRDWSKLDQVADAMVYNRRSNRQMWVWGAILAAVIVAAIVVLG
jgi:hypothetical protein